MEEKVLEFIEKMYSEMQNGFTDLREGQTRLEEGQTRLEEGQDKFEKRLDKLEKGQIKLENELKETKDTLFDGYKQTYEKLEALENKVDKIAAIVESHDVKIEVLRGVK